VKRLLSILLFAVATHAAAQTHEVAIIGQYGGYAGESRPGDRVVALEYYLTVSPHMKVFAGGAAQQRWGESDQSFGGGAYFTPDPDNAFFASAHVGIAPAVIPSTDVSAEYTRVLQRGFTASFLYRLMVFPDATVHIAAPTAALYTIPRTVLSARVFLSMIAGTGTVTGTFQGQAWYEPDDTWSPGISYTVGNEAYRAGALQDLTTSSSWSLAVNLRIRLSAFLLLRASFEHLYRIGSYRQNTAFASLAFRW
jgi:YaiO family outer membrane protein